MAATTVSQAMPASATADFDAATVDSSTRTAWCRSQTVTCPDICIGESSVNECSPNDLTYSCTCSNGTVPDCTAFTSTLPWFICQQTFEQCIGNNPNDAQAQQACTQNEQCGSRNATAERLAVESPGSSLPSSSSSSNTRSSSSTRSSSTRTSSSETTERASETAAQESASATSTTGSSAPPNTSSSSLSTGAIAGIAIGCILLGVLLASFFFWRYRRRQKRKTKPRGPAVAEMPENAYRIRELEGHSNAKWEMATNANRHELPTEKGGPKTRTEIAEMEATEREKFARLR